MEMKEKMMVCFGEILMRLSPQGYDRFLQADQWDIIFGGGEANVAAALSGFGMPSRFVTKLPDNDVARACVRQLRSFGVDTSQIVYGGDRMAIYFLERGAGERPSKVIYDRKYSSMSMCSFEDFDWDASFAEAGWFHVSGITPAIGPQMPDVTLRALQEAKKRGLCVSCDVNFRSLLWDTQTAGKAMCSLLPYVDVCITNEEHAKTVLGIRTSRENPGDEVDYVSCREIAQSIAQVYGCRKVAITLRRTISAQVNLWGSYLYDADSGRDVHTDMHQVQMIDRVGSGDAFSAGLIYGLAHGEDDGSALSLGTGACCLKHTVEGDMALMSLEEARRAGQGGGSARVQR